MKIRATRMIGDVKWEFESENDDVKLAIAELSPFANILTYDASNKKPLDTKNLKLGANINKKNQVFVWVKNMVDKTVSKLGTYTSGKHYWWKDYEPGFKRQLEEDEE